MDFLVFSRFSFLARTEFCQFQLRFVHRIYQADFFWTEFRLGLVFLSVTFARLNFTLVEFYLGLVLPVFFFFL